MSDIVSRDILVSSSLFSSHSGLAGAVLRLPGYALVVVSEKYDIVSDIVLKKSEPSQASANIRSQEYIPYSPNIAFAWRSGISERHSRKYSRVDEDVDILKPVVIHLS
jgi:hypothetical protein